MPRVTAKSPRLSTVGIAPASHRTCRFPVDQHRVPKTRGIAEMPPTRHVVSTRCCREPVSSEQLARGLRTHGLAEHIALRIFAAELIKLDRVGVGLRTFRHHLHAEIV